MGWFGRKSDLSERQVLKLIQSYSPHEPARSRALEKLRPVKDRVVQLLSDMIEQGEIDRLEKSQERSKTGFEWAVELLDDLGWERPRWQWFLPLAESESRGHQTCAAKWIVRWGDANAREAITTLAHQDEGKLRVWICFGVRDLVKTKRGTTDYREWLYALLLRFLESDDSSHLRNFATGLLDLDRPRASHELSDRLFAATSSRFAKDVADALNDKRVLLPFDRVTELWDRLAGGEDFCDSCLRSELMIAAARVEPSRSWPMIDRCLNDSTTYTRFKALEVAAELEGFPNVTERDVLRKFDIPEVRVLSDIEDFHREVQNGGITQFFSNGYGDRYDPLIHAVERLGFPHAKELLQQARKVFDPDGPPTEGDTTAEFFRRMTEDQERILKIAEPVSEMPFERAQLEFMRANREIFHKAKELGARRVAELRIVEEGITDVYVLRTDPKP